MMGNCAAKCSRKTVHQTPRIDPEEYIRDVKTGIQKHQDVQNEQEESLILDLSHSDVKEQIFMELKALKAQIAKKEALLCYLQSEGYKLSLTHLSQVTPHHKPHYSWECLEDEKRQQVIENSPGFLSCQKTEHVLKQNSLDTQVHSETTRSSSTSSSNHKLGTVHFLHCAQSCPALTSASSVSSQYTQTEPVVSTNLLCDKSSSKVYPTETKRPYGLIKSNTVDCDTTFYSGRIKNIISSQNQKTCLLSVPSEQPENEFPVSPFPRNRSSSFICAIKQGNPNICDSNEVSNKIIDKTSTINNNNLIEKQNCFMFETCNYPNSTLKSLNVIKNFISESVQDQKMCSITTEKNSSFPTCENKILVQDPCCNKKNVDQFKCNTDKEDIIQGGKDRNPVQLCEMSSKKCVDSSNSQLNCLSGITRCPSFDCSEEEDVGVGSSENCLTKKECCNTISNNPLVPTNNLMNTNKSGSMNTLITDIHLPSSSEITAFPSLPDMVLKRIGVLEPKLSNSEISEEEIKEKFGVLSVAFKTDKCSLERRLQTQRNSRNSMEKNINNEIKSLNELFSNLNQNCTSSEIHDRVNKILSQVEIIQKLISRMSGRSELYGAVKQELRMVDVLEIMMLHIENVKKKYEKDHKELEETHQILIDNHVLQEAKNSPTSGPKASRAKVKPKTKNILEIPQEQTGLKS